MRISEISNLIRNRSAQAGITKPRTSHTIFQHPDGIASGTLTTDENHAHIGGGIRATGGAAKAYSTCSTALGRACAAGARCTIQFDVNARSR